MLMLYETHVWKAWKMEKFNRATQGKLSEHFPCYMNQTINILFIRTRKFENDHIEKNHSNNYHFSNNFDRLNNIF